MKALKIILIILAILFVVLVLLLGYFGFIPGLSKLFKADKPRNLNATQSTEEDRDGVYKKIGVKIAYLPDMALPEESLKFSGSVPQDIYLTQKDVNALVNDTRWRYYPVSSVQVKIHPDGTAEASGIIQTGSIEGFAKAFGIPDREIKRVLDAAKLIKTDPPFYLRGKLNISNNHTDLTLERAQIGRLPIPQGIISSNRGLVNSFIDGRLKFIDGLEIKSFIFKNSQIKFEGSLPDYTSFTEK